MQNVELLLRHSILAYREAADIAVAVGEAGGKGIQILDDPVTGTRGHVAELANGTVVVAFRGSEFRASDWKTNASRRFCDCPNGRVHRGFLSAYQSIESALLDRIGFEQKVLITGHSLGGALATLAALPLHLEGRYVAEVHTFGSPRVGDARFASCYDSLLRERTWRHVNRCDAVPHVPTSRWHRYVHVGQQVYYDQNGDRHIDPSWLFRVMDYFSTRLSCAWSVPPVWVRDHFVSCYRSVVQGD